MARSGPKAYGYAAPCHARHYVPCPNKVRRRRINGSELDPLHAYGWDKRGRSNNGVRGDVRLAGPERLTGARYRPTYEIRAHVWHLDGSGAPVAFPYQDRIGQSVRDLGRASWDADQSTSVAEVQLGLAIRIWRAN